MNLDFIASGPALVPWVVLAAAMLMLTKGADFFVDSAVAVSSRLHIPHLVIGIVLVSLSTTTPELAVSVTSALQGRPEMALSNAIGSVICNCGLALALCGLCSRHPVPVHRHVLTATGGVLLGACLLLFVFIRRDNNLMRSEGVVLSVVLAAYLGYMFIQHRTGRHRDAFPLKEAHPAATRGLPAHVVTFAAGLVAIILASRFIVASAVAVAAQLGIPETVVALTLVALGTSIPEVATSITAAVKGHGALSVGNILGASILNICWVAAASAIVTPLTIERQQTLYTVPAMLILVVVTLVVLRTGHQLSRREGGILLGLYILYLAGFAVLFR